MKRLILAATILISCHELTKAQTNIVQVSKVVDAEKDFSRLVERKGIKEAFLSVADPEGVVFKPDVVKITDFYNSIDKQPGTLTWKPKFARISANGDLAFTAGPYIYLNGKNEDDKVYGDYVSVWRADLEGKFKLLIDLGIQHPENEQEELTDFKNPDSAKRVAPSKDPFNGRSIIIGTDKIFNHELTVSALATYKEFLSPEARYYFPGFEPITGTDKIMAAQPAMIWLTAMAVPVSKRERSSAIITMYVSGKSISSTNGTYCWRYSRLWNNRDNRAVVVYCYYFGGCYNNLSIISSAERPSASAW